MYDMQWQIMLTTMMILLALSKRFIVTFGFSHCLRVIVISTWSNFWTSFFSNPAQYIIENIGNHIKLFFWNTHYETCTLTISCNYSYDLSFFLTKTITGIFPLPYSTTQRITKPKIEIGYIFFIYSHKIYGMISSTLTIFPWAIEDAYEWIFSTMYAWNA